MIMPSDFNKHPTDLCTPESGGSDRSFQQIGSHDGSRREDSRSDVFRRNSHTQGGYEHCSSQSTEFSPPPSHMRYDPRQHTAVQSDAGGYPSPYLREGVHPPPQYTASFDSYPTTGPVPPPGPASYHYPSSYPYPPPTGYPYYQWAPVRPIEYIADIHSEDVLSGRGGATNSHSGNRHFRSLVSKYKQKYLKAKKRDKPAVASIVVEKIREKGGRFLRRIDTTPQGHVLWVDIGDDRAREKTCQALREGAPELRKKRKATSSTDEDDYHLKESESSSTSSSLEQAASTDETPGKNVRGRSGVRAPRFNSEAAPVQYRRDGPIMIRPSAKLFQRRRVPKPVSVDELNSVDREKYLRDFLPPDPTIRRSTSNNQVLLPSLPVLGHTDGSDDSSSQWQVVKV